MGDRGPAHKDSTLFGCANDLHSGGILNVIHTRDYPITRVSISIVLDRPQVYNSFLGELPTSYGDTVDVEHCFLSPNGWSVKEDHPDIRGHATGMCLSS